MYADDTVLFKEINLESDIEDQIGKINNDLERLGLWCKRNKLTINVTKSKGMLFTAPLSNYRNMDTAVLPELLLNDTKLDYVKVYKYLGVNLDSHLKMNSIISKTRPVVYKMSKIRYIVDSATAVRMYKTHVLPILEFGLYVLDNYYSNQVSRLQKIQNRCLRLCFRKDYRYPEIAES